VIQRKVGIYKVVTNNICPLCSLNYGRDEVNDLKGRV